MLNGYLCRHSNIMKRKIFIAALLGAFSVLALTVQISAQCVVINEILINGPGTADGQAPNSEEWIELYNTCDNDVDLSCYALADGDFVIRFPAGSTIPANGYFTIGSPNSAVPLDLNQFACGCTNPANQGIIFTNGAEQVVLMDNNGVILDALIWGGGQALPFTVSSSPAGCTAINATVSNGNANFETLPPTNNDNGCVCARECDGSPNWEVRCGASITADGPNQTPFIVNFNASATTICEGDCVSFSNLSIGAATSWTWSFVGANTTTSNQQNPANICYNSAGFYDVALTVSDGCATNTLTIPDFIEVSSIFTPIITADGPTSFCEGDQVTLNTTPGNEYQWFENGNPIIGAITNTLVVDAIGNYSVATVNLACGGESTETVVDVLPLPVVTITADAPTEICPGQTVTLFTNSTADLQWLESGNILTGQESSSYTVTEAGVYSLQATENGCSNVSNIITIEEIAVTQIILTSVDDVICAGESTTIDVVSNEVNFVWYLDNVIIPGESGASLVASSIGTYSVEVVNSTCPIVVTPLTISAGSIPNGTITPNGLTTLCEGSSIDLTLAGNFAAFDWTLDGSPINNTATTISASTEGIYTVTLTSADGCPGIAGNDAQITVVLPQVVTISSSEGNAICEGTTTDLTATQNLSNYSWTFNGNAIGNTTNVLQNQVAGQYSFSAIDSNGCDVEGNILVAEIPNPIVSLSPTNDIVICDDNTTITASGGSAYQWYFNNNIVPGVTSNTLVVNQNGNYYATTTNQQGCEGSSNPISVFLQGALDIEITGPTSPICEGETFTLTLPQAYTSYDWSTGQTSSTLTVSENGTYSVQVADDQGCVGSDDITINFVKLPEIALLSTFRSDCVNGVEVTAVSDGLISWEISPFITLLDNNRIIANPESTSSYSVTSTVGTCESQTDFDILVECPTLFIPNVFTPNDDGVNDFFRIEGENLGQYEMIIFNRWGDEVYRGTNINRGWNGGINGYYAPDGTYNYIIKIFDLSGQPLFGDGVYHGTVTLLR